MVAKKGGKVSKYKEEKVMAKLCPRGKAAAKRKFKVYPSRMLICMLLEFVLVKLHLVVKKEEKKMGGGMIRPMYKSGGSVKTGCGKVMSNKRKTTKVY